MDHADKSTPITNFVTDEDLFAQNAIADDINVTPAYLEHNLLPNPVPQVPLTFVLPSAVTATISPSTDKESRKRPRVQARVADGPKNKRQRKDPPPLPEDMKKIPIVAFNCSSAELDEFFKQCLKECQKHYPNTVRHVNLELIRMFLERICNEIWSRGGNLTYSYLVADKTRLVRLSLWISSDVRHDIILTLEEFDTIMFIMSCLRNHSTKGNSKYKKVLEVTHLTAQLIHERMTTSIPANIYQYYMVTPKSERKTLPKNALVTISDKQTRPDTVVVSFDELLHDEAKFIHFVKTKKAKETHNTNLPVGFNNVIIVDFEPVNEDNEHEKNNEEDRDEMLASLNELNAAVERENGVASPAGQPAQEGANANTPFNFMEQLTEAMDSFPEFNIWDQQPAEDNLTEQGWTNTLLLESQQ